MEGSQDLHLMLLPHLGLAPLPPFLPPHLSPASHLPLPPLPPPTPNQQLQSLPTSLPVSRLLRLLLLCQPAPLPLNPTQLFPFLPRHRDHLLLPLLPAHLLLAALQPLSLSPDGSPRVAPLLNTTSQRGRWIAIWTRRAFSNGSSL